MTTSRRSDQPDLYRDSPTRHAEAWRAAAESCRQQFPDDHARYRYYADRATQLEAQSEQ